MFYPEWISDDLKLAVHNKFTENIVIAVYRGKRLVGEAFIPIRAFSETESLHFDDKVTIFAPREEKKSKEKGTVEARARRRKAAKVRKQKEDRRRREQVHVHVHDITLRKVELNRYANPFFSPPK